MKKFSIDMADCKGVPLRRALASAERFKDDAIRFGSLQVKTPGAKSSALLCAVTSPDRYFLDFGVPIFFVRCCQAESGSCPAAQLALAPSS